MTSIVLLRKETQWVEKEKVKRLDLLALPGVGKKFEKLKKERSQVESYRSIEKKGGEGGAKIDAGEAIRGFRGGGFREVQVQHRGAALTMRPTIKGGSEASG